MPELCQTAPLRIDEPVTKRIAVALYQDRDAIARMIRGWEQLAVDAGECNVFQEHWMLLPAFQHYGDLEVQVAFVQEETNKPNSRPRLIGVFPLEFTHAYRGLPVGCVRLWKHPHCYLATPLMARGFEKRCWQALLQRLRAESTAGRILELPTISADGPVWSSLQEYSFEHHIPLPADEFYSRAMLRLMGSGEEYLRAHMSGDHRRCYARKKRLLASQGVLRFGVLRDNEDAEPWISAFLQLEASGWKGKAATAMACQEADRQFLTTISLEAHRRRRLMMMRLELDGRPIAMHHGLLVHGGSFALKIAYDEAFARYSPGMLLEIEALHYLHEQRPCGWIDSCSALGNRAMRRVWKQDRLIATLACPTGKWGSRLLVAGFPLLRHLRWRASERFRRRTGAVAE